MKKQIYLIFGGSRYYASGGAYDFISSHDDLDKAWHEAQQLIGKELVIEKSDFSDDPEDDTTIQIEWSHVFDAIENRIVAKYGADPYGFASVPIEVRDEIE